MCLWCCIILLVVFKHDLNSRCVSFVLKSKIYDTMSEMFDSRYIWHYIWQTILWQIWKIQNIYFYNVLHIFISGETCIARYSARYGCRWWREFRPFVFYFAPVPAISIVRCTRYGPLVKFRVGVVGNVWVWRRSSRTKIGEADARIGVLRNDSPPPQHTASTPPPIPSP